MDVIEATLACSIPSSFLVPLPRSEGWVARRGRERNPAKPLFSTTSLMNRNFLKSSLRSIFLFRSLPSAHFRQEDMCHSCPSLSKEFLSDLKQQGRYTPRRGRKRRENKREKPIEKRTFPTASQSMHYKMSSKPPISARGMGENDLALCGLHTPQVLTPSHSYFTTWCAFMFSSTLCKK